MSNSNEVIPIQTQQSVLGQKRGQEEDQTQAPNKRPTTNLDIAKDKLNKIEEKLKTDPGYQLSNSKYINMITALGLIPEEEHNLYPHVMEYLRREKEAEKNKARVFLSNLNLQLPMPKPDTNYRLTKSTHEEMITNLNIIPQEEYSNYPKIMAYMRPRALKHINAMHSKSNKHGYTLSDLEHEQIEQSLKWFSDDERKRFSYFTERMSALDGGSKKKRKRKSQKVKTKRTRASTRRARRTRRVRK